MKAGNRRTGESKGNAKRSCHKLLRACLAFQRIIGALPALLTITARRPGIPHALPLSGRNSQSLKSNG
jgi:hypothetical protein